MKESATMSDTTAPAPAAAETKVKTQVSATLSPELFARVEDYRWSNRINKTSEIVAKAVAAFIDAEEAKAKGK